MRAKGNGLLRYVRRPRLLEPLILCSVLAVLMTTAWAADVSDCSMPGFAPPASAGPDWSGACPGFEAGVSQIRPR